MLLSILLANALASVPDTTANIAIDFVDGTGATELVAIRDETAIEDIDWVDLETIDEGLATATVPADQLDTVLGELRANPLVEVAEPFIRYEIMAMPTTFGLDACDPGDSPSEPNDPDWKDQWHMRHESIQAPWVWKNTKSGKGIVVAVLDTGLTVTSDMDPAQVSPAGRSFVDGSPLTDLQGHGTHCAATIAEWTNNGKFGTGLANQATILPIKVLSDSGMGYAHWIAAGIDYAIEQKADIISMSLGSSAPSGIIHAAVKRAHKAGVIVVAAAGNSGHTPYPQPGYPGAHPETIGVGSIGPSGARAFYSSYGPGLDIMAPGGDKNTPGGGVFQLTAPRGKEAWSEFQGTSMATPHVAAAVAVLLAEGASHDPEKMKKLLTDTAVLLDGQTEREYGKGTIRLKDAILKVRGEESTEAAVVETANLPTPSPVGKLTYAVGLLTIGLLALLRKVYTVSPRFTVYALAAGLLSSGPLYALSTLPYNLHGLSALMIPFMEFPEYIVGAGASGFPLWLSPLPFMIPWFFMTPIARVRPLIVGFLSSVIAYMTLNLFVGFNSLWGLGPFAASIWQTVSIALIGVMVIISMEFNRQRGED